jgi:hypothetical protein
MSSTYDRINDLQQQLHLATEFMNRSSTQEMLLSNTLVLEEERGV